MVAAGIPVMGHIGLTPQTASQLGGYKVQGRDLDSARKMVAAAQGLQEAGAFGLVLECIPDQLAGIITETLSIPTIGIGAGAQCDGQVLVTHDLLGMFDKFIPSFVKSYTRLSPLIKENVTRYAEEVRTGAFPDEAHSFTTQLDLGKLLDKP
jgi:3-methyl-2-oxobutanoate hydroxymethyltransferase